MFDSIFLGGTFDQLHKGHDTILRRAFGLGERVTVGMTSDEFIKRYKSNEIKHKSFTDRRQNLTDWFRENKLSDRSEIIPIDDPFEPAASGNYQALIVTSENRSRGEEINIKRSAKNLPPLTLIEVPMVIADDGQPISSTRIRQGKIDPQGHMVMPESLRQTLQKPLGRLLSTEKDISDSLENFKNKVLVTVGDMATKSLLDTGITPKLSIVDLQVNRKPFIKLKDYNFVAESHIVAVVSGPGFITTEAGKAIWEWSESLKDGSDVPWVIVVSGEEDLLVLPVMVNAPNNTVIYYGQPEINTPTGKNKAAGIVEVIVDNNSKNMASQLLSQFK